MQQTASGPQRERGNNVPTDRLRGHRFSLLTNHRIGDRPLRMEDVQAEQLRGAFRTVQPLAFSNRQLSVGRIRPYFSSSALFNAVTIAPSKAKSATLFQWSELFCKSVTERHKSPGEYKKEARQTFIPRKSGGLPSRRNNVLADDLKPLPHYAETRPYIESRSLIHFQDSPDPKTFSK